MATEPRCVDVARLTNLVLLDTARLVGRVRLTAEEGPDSHRLVPSMAEGDLCRILPRLMRRLADLIDANQIPVECGVTACVLRDAAEHVEVGGFPHRPRTMLAPPAPPTGEVIDEVSQSIARLHLAGADL